MNICDQVIGNICPMFLSLLFGRICSFSVNLYGSNMLLTISYAFSALLCSLLLAQIFKYALIASFILLKWYLLGSFPRDTWDDGYID